MTEGAGCRDLPRIRDGHRRDAADPRIDYAAPGAARARGRHLATGICRRQCRQAGRVGKCRHSRPAFAGRECRPGSDLYPMPMSTAGPAGHGSRPDRTRCLRFNCRSGAGVRRTGVSPVLVPPVTPVIRGDPGSVRGDHRGHGRPASSGPGSEADGPDPPVHSQPVRPKPDSNGTSPGMTKKGVDVGRGKRVDGRSGSDRDGAGIRSGRSGRNRAWDDWRGLAADLGRNRKREKVP